MAGIVLDCSAVVAWRLDERRDREFMRIFDFAMQEGGHVPGIFKLEVCNSLIQALRDGRLDAAGLIGSFSDIGKVRFRIDNKTDEHAWQATRDMALKHGLTSYDASYVELAVRRNAALGTLDRKMAAAADAEGVQVLPIVQK